MFINFWYAAEWSGKVTAEPLKLRMVGQDFVLYRHTAGQVRCLANVCVHRGWVLDAVPLVGAPMRVAVR